MLFANVCAGFISSCYGERGFRRFLGFWASPWCLVHMEGASLASLPLCVHRARVTEVCLSLDTPFGRSRWRHCLCNLCGVCCAAHKTASHFMGMEVILLVESRTCWPQWDSPVSIVIMHVWFIGPNGHSGEIAGINNVRPLFLLCGFFCLVEILLNVSGV